MIRKLFFALFIITIIPLVYSQEYKFYALSNDGSNTEPVYLCKLDGCLRLAWWRLYLKGKSLEQQQQ